MPSYRDDARYRKVYAYYRPVPKPFDPTAVSKDYVDDALRAIDYKQSVRLAMSTNIDISVTCATLDSLSLVDEDRILLKGQTDPAENGIYIWYSATQLLSRTLDAADIFLNSGATVYVEEGTYAKTYWTLTTTDPVSVGVTEQDWENRIGSPSGADTEVQFNKLGMLSGSQYFSYNYPQSALSHGFSVTASGLYSHAEGEYTTGSGDFSHAQGLRTEASGTHSFAGGLYTIASGSGQTVVGKYNKRSNDFSLFVVGAGTDDNNRSDILRVNQGQIQITGSLNVSGDLNVNGTTTAINTTNLEVKDSLIGMGFASGSIAQTSGDRGWIGGINAGTNTFNIWDASNSEFAFGSTSDTPSTSDVAISAYSPLRISNLQASRVTASLGFSGSHTRLADNTSAFIQGSGILITSASNGAVTISSLTGNSGSFWSGGSIGANNSILTADGFGGIVSETDLQFDAVTKTLSLASNSRFTQGSGVQATGNHSHARGISTVAQGTAATAIGYLTKATGGSSLAIGALTLASGEFSVAHGTKTTGSIDYAYAHGDQAIASGFASHAEGYLTTATIHHSHAEGRLSDATGTGAHAEGYNTTAQGNDSHSEGINTIASGYASHAEGNSTTALGDYSHAEGLFTRAEGVYANTIGNKTLGLGQFSFAAGNSSTGSVDYSFAIGLGTIASGTYSFTNGQYTIASGSYQTVIGKYNKRDNNSSIFVVGNGTGDANANRSDILRVNTSSVEVTGSLTATFGLSGSLTRLSDGISPYLLAGTNIQLTTGSNGEVTIASAGAGAAAGGSDAQVQYNKLNALAGNAAMTFNDGTGILTSQTVLPRVDNTYDLGSATQRWANVYTGDLHLKNDRGDWTLIEEEDCLTVRNNATGKRYKIAMTPMDE